MALPDAIQNARHTGLTITWSDESGTAVDLTGATITGYKKNKSTKTVTALGGALSLSDAANGVFTWAYGATDVATPGVYEVQFLATFGVNDIEKTLLETWRVHNALDDDV